MMNEATSPIPPENVSVLLVEDDDVDVEVIRRLFEKHNIKNPLYHAGSGIEALEILRGANDGPKLARPYLMLVDINLPLMNGIEFLRAVRADDKLKKSIAFMLTTSFRDADIAQAYELNAAGYFLKDNLLQLVDLFTVYQKINRFPNGEARWHMQTA
jgi:CheY-like chemotaxis protein